MLGVTFPGIPGVILGSNGHLAWAATVSEHDVNDVYLETITPCGGVALIAGWLLLGYACCAATKK